MGSETCPCWYDRRVNFFSPFVLTRLCLSRHRASHPCERCRLRFPRGDETRILIPLSRQAEAARERACCAAGLPAWVDVPCTEYVYIQNPAMSRTFCSLSVPCAF